MQPLHNRLAVTPIIEGRSDIIWTPEVMSRWGNGLQATKGRVVAVGPEVDSVQVGELVHFSDSCGKPAGEYLLIREDDVMFVEDEPCNVAWVGAQEITEEVPQ